MPYTEYFVQASVFSTDHLLLCGNHTREITDGYNGASWIIGLENSSPAGIIALNLSATGLLLQGDLVRISWGHFNAMEPWHNDIV